MSVRNPNTLYFTFNNIMLPDSNVNEVASHGFVKFKIDQKKDLPLGTIIENSADIFFDFNTAIRTNKTFHTIAEPLISVDIETPFIENIEINAYPNPFEESTKIEVKGTQFEKLDLYLFDVNGRDVTSIQAKFQRFTLKRKGLSPGMYFYRIEGDGALIGVGKIIVQ